MHKGQKTSPQIPVLSMYLFSKKELKQSNQGLEELKDLILQKESSFLQEGIRLGLGVLG